MERYDADLKQYNREIKRAQKKLLLLKYQREQIAKEINELRKIKRELTDAVNKSIKVYDSLQKQMIEMTDYFSPNIGNDTKEKMRRASKKK